MQGSLTNLFNHNSVVTYPLKNQIKTIIFLSGISLSLISCGGGAGGGLPPNPEPVGKVQGTAFIGAVDEGEVNIYEFKSGVRGASLAKTNINVTDAGAYSVDLQTSSKSIMVCLSKAIYTETTSDAVVFFTDDQELCAIENYISGDTFNVSLTYYSHVSAGLATRLLDFNVDTSNAVNDSNEEIKNWIGYNINTVVPVDIRAPYPNPSLTQVKAGFATAAISVYTGWVNGVSGIAPKLPNGSLNPKRHAIYNSILFAQRAYQDIVADGVLDGKSNLGPTGLGAVPLSVNTYRRFIALDMLVLSKSPKNKTSISKPSELFQSAVDYSNFDKKASLTAPAQRISKLNIFGKSESGTPLSDLKPFLKNFIVPKVITGNVKIAASIIDLGGLTQSVEFRIINTSLNIDDQFGFFDTTSPNLARSVATLSNAEISPNVYKYPDGKGYKILIRAAYSTGPGTTAPNPVEKVLGAIIGNVGTQVEGISPAQEQLNPVTNIIEYQKVTGKFNLFAGVSNPLGVSSVILTIDDVITVPAGNFDATENRTYTVPIFRLDTLTVNNGVALTDGLHKFVLTAVGDVNGTNQTIEKTINYIVDNTVPTVRVNPPTTLNVSGWFTNDFTINVIAEDGLEGSQINNVKIIMDGSLLETVSGTSTSNLKLIYQLANIPDGIHKFRVQATDNVGLTGYGSQVINIKTDSSPPSLDILQSNIAGQECVLNVNPADFAGPAGGIGSGVKNVIINGIVKGAVTAPFQYDVTSLITIGVNASTAQVTNFTAEVEDFAGLISTKGIQLTATRPTATTYTCQFIIN